MVCKFTAHCSENRQTLACVQDIHGLFAKMVARRKCTKCIIFFTYLFQSKPDSTELGSPKTTDDIVQEKGEEGRAARRRHKTESVKQPWSQEKALAAELEQAQRCCFKFHQQHQIFIPGSEFMFFSCFPSFLPICQVVTVIFKLEINR